MITKPTKKPREQAVEIMLTELKGMIGTLLVCNGVVIISCIVYGFMQGHDFRFYTGLLIGNTAAVLNFYHLGVKAGNIMKMREVRRARVYAIASFFLRYFGAFAVFWVLIRFGVVNIITVLVPLFFPKIHYTVKAVVNKNV
jgi:hypothetical protein